MLFRRKLMVGVMLAGTVLSPLSLADAGKDFLQENSKKPGVTTTASGLQYKVVKAGQGVSPAAADLVKVHYHGTLINGEVFDSSVDRGEPISFALNQVIKGWTEGLQTMKEGGKTILYIPPDIAYGSRSTGPIPANSTLIFEVELLKVFALNTPKNLAEVKAFKITPMDCGKPPVLPEEKSKLAEVKEQAESYSACAREHYKLLTSQLDALMRVARTGDQEMIDAVLDSVKIGKQDMSVQLEVAINFIKSYQEMMQ